MHFHAVIRVDGPNGATDPAPAGLGDAELRAAVTHAARTATITATRPDGTALTLGWGAQLDLRPVTASAARQVEDADGAITDTALAGYIAKYATKTTGATPGADRPIREIEHVEHLDLTAHHAAMIRTAWDLGGQERYEELNLRRWAHMLAFRGHFLTKSQRYSVTFRALRAERRLFRLRADLDALAAETADDNAIPIDLATVVVVNDWWPVHFGHRNDGERELAAAIAEKHRNLRRSTTASDTRRAA